MHVDAFCNIVDVLRSGIASTFEGAATDVAYQFWVNNKWVDERPKSCTPTGFSKEEAPPDFKWYANTPRTEVGLLASSQIWIVKAAKQSIGLMGHNIREQASMEDLHCQLNKICLVVEGLVPDAVASDGRGQQVGRTTSDMAATGVG
jgi:hypothetical protein